MLKNAKNLNGRRNLESSGRCNMAGQITPDRPIEPNKAIVPQKNQTLSPMAFRGSLKNAKQGTRSMANTRKVVPE